MYNRKPEALQRGCALKTGNSGLPSPQRDVEMARWPVHPGGLATEAPLTASLHDDHVPWESTS